MSPGEDGLIGIPFPEHSSELLSRLNAQRRAGLLCDLTLTSRGAHYPTHRSVMAAVSQYFRRLFGAEEGEEGSGEGVGGSCSVCQLDCVEPDALDALLEFAYTATLTIRSSGMREVLKGAQLLGIQCVADACRDILGEEADEDVVSTMEGERKHSRRKQDRCTVGKAASPVRPTWRHSQTDFSTATSPTPKYGLPPTLGREEQPQNGATRASHLGLLANGSIPWHQDDTPLPQATEDLPSEDEQIKHEGQSAEMALAAPLQAERGGANVGGGRKRKSQTPQQCPVCQKIIHGAGKLPRHMRTHTGEKPFQCTTCGVRFTRNDKLKIHMRKHTGERPYPCPDCPARFLHSYDLKNHLSLHSGARPFECQLCHKAFAREDHLQRHRKGHSCLELRTRRPRRSTTGEPSPHPEQLGLHPSSTSSMAQLLYPQDAMAVQAMPMLSTGRLPYPGLIWRAMAGHGGRSLEEGGERSHSPNAGPTPANEGWEDEDEEEEEEEEGEEEIME